MSLPTPAEIDAVLARHNRIVLQFSGGKDSLATLLLLEPWWDRIVVAWGSRGADYPETHETIERIRKLPFHAFAEVRPPIPHDLSMEAHGLPSDLIPLRNETEHAHLSGQPISGPRIQSYAACCNRLLWAPLARFVSEYGATLVIRGQRNGEHMKGPARNGDVINGVEYLLPLEEAAELEVHQVVEESGWSLPDHYQYVAKSLDCWSCTAYLDESHDRHAYTREFHPELWRRLRPRLQMVYAVVRRELRHLEQAARLTEEP